MTGVRRYAEAFAASVFVTVVGALISHWSGLQIHFIIGWLAATTFLAMLK